ncbi:Disease resistance protein RPM1 [Acorus gramineus]|uniref:Disease resistance protein RPM1 n=1 Tax=Acorus gramineus TaxID=55184 RepID=A0AAV9BBD5_ACOGR|nr:Disease resistance protein RPM1 [Acorus gramineus]
MLNLVSVVFLQGGMPELREFQLQSCVELKEPPKGVHYLTKLQQLSLVLMPEEFIEKIRRMDRSSSAFKHIADVKHHSRGADGRWTVQLL